MVGVKLIRLSGYEIPHRSTKSDPDRLEPLLNLSLSKDLKSQQRVFGLFAYCSQWNSHYSDKT